LVEIVAYGHFIIKLKRWRVYLLCLKFLSKTYKTIYKYIRGILIIIYSLYIFAVKIIVLILVEIVGANLFIMKLK
jgi:hypothetical protein